MRSLLYPLLIATSLLVFGSAAYGQKVGMLLGSYVSSRWYLDQKLFTDKATELGLECLVEIAYTPEEQLQQAREMIAAGAKVLVVVALDATKAGDIVEVARGAGVPVICYDRLIFSNHIAAYLSFDNVEVGRLQAKYMLERVPKGTYYLINGPVSDYNAVLFRQGQLEVLQPHIDKGSITIAGDVVLDQWSQLDAFEILTQYYESDAARPDVIIAANDALASGVIQALPSEVAGKVYVSGQDADLNGIRNIISGNQSMTVYKPIRPLADMAANMAKDLAMGKEIQGQMKFKIDTLAVESILLDPIVVDKKNYKETVLADGHASLSEVVNNLGEAFEQERNKIRLSLLEKEKALEIQKKESQRNIFFIVGVFLLLSISGLGFTVYHKQRDNRKLNLQKEVIERQNEELNESNDKLRNYNEELTQQQEEITAQRDAIAQQNKKLEEVRQIMEKQRDEILHQNERLEAKVQQRTAELVQHVQQLEEYAFLTTHNLRAPVARILGLGHLIQNKQSKPEEQQYIINELTSASEELRSIFEDLNTILDIRTFSHEALSEVNLEVELKCILANLSTEIEQKDVTVNVDLGKAKTIFSVKPYVHSILFNLLSNAIKFRHPERQAMVGVSGEIKDRMVCLRVSDNGLGIEKEYLENVFQLYKRFHFHVKGRGIGLFLVKTQVESLGGRVDIVSEAGKGTTVHVFLPHGAERAGSG